MSETAAGRAATVGIAEVNEARLWYEDAGEGEVVVFLHEAIGDARMWDAQWGAFSSRYRAIRLDLRGFGRSTLPGGPYSHARDVVELFRWLGVDRAALVGGSMGAAVALQVVLLQPELVSALVLLAPGVVDEWSETVRRFGEAEDAALERGDLDAAVRLNLDLWVAGPSRSLADVDPDVVARVSEMQRRAFEVMLPAYDGDPPPHAVPPFPGSVLDRLADVRAPALVVTGDRDVEDIHASARRLVAELPRARHALIENAAHAANMERPDEFNRLVLEFLADVL